ncbi:iron chelate uptake ABC transporter family permease subunit [Frigidibacter sp. MR17.24]|uniref:iron chelate uptake ABC transporter family permease subunit n=1 Tax=Frigidibacter sp. MR17.24 TaxID=3127345 RepID=UPI003FA58E01
MPARADRRRAPAGRPAGLWLAAAALVVVCALWLVLGLGRGWAFILQLRAEKLAGMLIVGASVSVATVLFQTVSRNRILTPQIMGFDALYMLGQVLLIASLGVVGYASLPAGPKFLAETVVMTAAALALFGTLLTRAGGGDVARMILTGVILGVLFRSLGGLVQRAMDPNDFAMVQAASFASFSRIDPVVLAWAAPVAIAAMAAAQRLAGRLDVLALGRDPAVSLGLLHDRLMVAALSLTAVLVAVSTALVGPVAFLGLITAGLGRWLAGSARHARLIPGAALAGGVLVVGGQFLFERVLGMAGTLSVVIEFAGGLVFLGLLLKGKVR